MTIRSNAKLSMSWEEIRLVAKLGTCHLKSPSDVRDLVQPEIFEPNDLSRKAETARGLPNIALLLLFSAQFAREVDLQNNEKPITGPLTLDSTATEAVMRIHPLTNSCLVLTGLVALGGLLSTGCAARHETAVAPVQGVARELSKMSHPAYVIEPPDILQIDLLTAVPNPPYRIKSLDVVGITVEKTIEGTPIAGPFTVEADGTIFLGPRYGRAAVVGLTVEEARVAIEKQLSPVIKDPVVSVTPVQTRAVQQIRGQHLVRSDGTVSLGVYGAVPVVGLTAADAKKVIEKHLQTFFKEPEVSVEIVGFNSKIYYVVFDYGGAGQQIQRLPITGNETVLDGISQTAGLPTVADARGIWLARPGNDECPPQVLPVDWKQIVECGDARTNYQILPGDRVFVKAYDIVATDNKLARLISPIERVFGVVLLGSSTVNSIRTNPNQNNLGNNFFR
jgi:polysaccharide biosynthesis/export protein